MTTISVVEVEVEVEDHPNLIDDQIILEEKRFNIPQNVIKVMADEDFKILSDVEDKKEEEEEEELPVITLKNQEEEEEVITTISTVRDVTDSWIFHIKFKEEEEDYEIKVFLKSVAESFLLALGKKYEPRGALKKLLDMNKKSEFSNIIGFFESISYEIMENWRQKTMVVIAKEFASLFHSYIFLWKQCVDNFYERTTVGDKKYRSKYQNYSEFNNSSSVLLYSIVYIYKKLTLMQEYHQKNIIISNKVSFISGNGDGDDDEKKDPLQPPKKKQKTYHPPGPLDDMPEYIVIEEEEEEEEEEEVEVKVKRLRRRAGRFPTIHTMNRESSKYDEEDNKLFDDKKSNYIMLIDVFQNPQNHHNSNVLNQKLDEFVEKLIYFIEYLRKTKFIFFKILRSLWENPSKEYDIPKYDDYEKAGFKVYDDNIIKNRPVEYALGIKIFDIIFNENAMRKRIGTRVINFLKQKYSAARYGKDTIMRWIYKAWILQGLFYVTRDPDIKHDNYGNSKNSKSVEMKPMSKHDINPNPVFEGFMTKIGKMLTETMKCKDCMKVLEKKLSDSDIFKFSTGLNRFEEVSESIMLLGMHHSNPNNTVMGTFQTHIKYYRNIFRPSIYDPDNIKYWIDRVAKRMNFNIIDGMSMRPFSGAMSYYVTRMAGPIFGYGFSAFRHLLPKTWSLTNNRLIKQMFGKIVTGKGDVLTETMTVIIEILINYMATTKFGRGLRTWLSPTNPYISEILKIFAKTAIRTGMFAAGLGSGFTGTSKAPSLLSTLNDRFIKSANYLTYADMYEKSIKKAFENLTLSKERWGEVYKLLFDDGGRFEQTVKNLLSATSQKVGILFNPKQVSLFNFQTKTLGKDVKFDYEEKLINVDSFFSVDELDISIRETTIFRNLFDNTKKSYSNLTEGLEGARGHLEESFKGLRNWMEKGFYSEFKIKVQDPMTIDAADLERKLDTEKIQTGGEVEEVEIDKGGGGFGFPPTFVFMLKQLGYNIFKENAGIILHLIHKAVKKVLFGHAGVHTTIVIYNLIKFVIRSFDVLNFLSLPTSNDIPMSFYKFGIGFFTSQMGGLIGDIVLDLTLDFWYFSDISLPSFSAMGVMINSFKDKFSKGHFPFYGFFGGKFDVDKIGQERDQDGNIVMKESKKLEFSSVQREIQIKNLATLKKLSQNDTLIEQDQIGTGIKMINDEKLESLIPGSSNHFYSDVKYWDGLTAEDIIDRMDNPNAIHNNLLLKVPRGYFENRGKRSKEEIISFVTSVEQQLDVFIDNYLVTRDPNQLDKRIREYFKPLGSLLSDKQIITYNGRFNGALNTFLSGSDEVNIFDHVRLRRDLISLLKNIKKTNIFTGTTSFIGYKIKSYMDNNNNNKIIKVNNDMIEKRIDSFFNDEYQRILIKDKKFEITLDDPLIIIKTTNKSPGKPLVIDNHYLLFRVPMEGQYTISCSVVFRSFPQYSYKYYKKQRFNFELYIGRRILDKGYAFIDNETSYYPVVILSTIGYPIKSGEEIILRINHRNNHENTTIDVSFEVKFELNLYKRRLDYYFGTNSNKGFNNIVSVSNNMIKQIEDIDVLRGKIHERFMKERDSSNNNKNKNVVLEFIKNVNLLHNTKYGLILDYTHDNDRLTLSTSKGRKKNANSFLTKFIHDKLLPLSFKTPRVSNQNIHVKRRDKDITRHLINVKWKHSKSGELTDMDVKFYNDMIKYKIKIPKEIIDKFSQRVKEEEEGKISRVKCSTGEIRRDYIKGISNNSNNNDDINNMLNVSII